MDCFQYLFCVQSYLLEAPQKTSHVDHGSTTQKSHIIIVVILVIVVFIAGAVICIVYGIFKNPPCRNSSDVSCTTSALSSADSVNKIEHKILCGWPMIHMARFLWSFSSCFHIWDEWVNTFLSCCFDFHYKIKFIYLYPIIRKMEREKQSIFDNK
jgi:hypothetical protein